MSSSSRGLHHNGLVVFATMFALLAMHGFTSDHGMGVPSRHVTTGTLVDHATNDASGAAHQMSNGPTESRASWAAAIEAATITSTSDHRMSHAGGMCVGVLGLSLLMWLLARARFLRLGPLAVSRDHSARIHPIRDGPTLYLPRPSIVKLCILRT